jgi:hypothetical protein
MNVHIAIHRNKVEKFEARWPMATFIRNDGKTFKVYSMPRQIYEKQYKKVDKENSVMHRAATNYVKITGVVSGQSVKLFVKETHVCKVLEKLTKDPSREGYSADAAQLTMRKVTLPNTKRAYVDPIIVKSLAAVGIAA